MQPIVWVGATYNPLDFHAPPFIRHISSRNRVRLTVKWERVSIPLILSLAVCQERRMFAYWGSSIPDSSYFLLLLCLYYYCSRFFLFLHIKGEVVLVSLFFYRGLQWPLLDHHKWIPTGTNTKFRPLNEFSHYLWKPKMVLAMMTFITNDSSNFIYQGDPSSSYMTEPGTQLQTKWNKTFAI